MMWKSAPSAIDRPVDVIRNGASGPMNAPRPRLALEQRAMVTPGTTGHEREEDRNPVLDDGHADRLAPLNPRVRR